MIRNLRSALPGFLSLLTLAFLAAISPPASGATLLNGFVEELVVAGNWDEAAGMKFGPNGRLFVWQRGGEVYSVDNGVRSPAPIVDISDEVGAWSDYGMVGFALHPNYYANGYIYLSYVVDRHHFLECSEPAAGVGPAECSNDYDPLVDDYFDATIGRVTRYTLIKPQGDPDYRNAVTVDYNSRKVIIGNAADDGCPILHISHGIGEILFATDGSLIIACGDGASANILDSGSTVGTHWAQALTDGIIDPIENVGAFRSQLLDSASGKLLRVDPETGDGLASNPFFDPGASRSPRSRTWALGLRNPFRIALRPGTGSHAMSDGDPGAMYLGDVGWNDFEEFNVVDAAGQNFGWPIYEGMEQFANGYPATERFNFSEPNPLFGQPGCDTSSDEFFDFRDLIIQDTLIPNPVWPNPCDAGTPIPPTADRFVHRRPHLEWNHDDGLPPRWSNYNGNIATQQSLGATAPNGEIVNGPLFPGNASVGGVWYTGTQYPVEYHNTYFHADFGAGWVKNMRLDGSNEFVRDPEIAISDFLDGGGAVVDLALSPSDGMLYYVEWPFRVWRIRYVGDGNFPPVALATSDKQFGAAPLTVQFSSTGSYDPEEGPLTFLWDFGDGQQSSDADPSHVFDPAGQVVGPQTYAVTLTVTDDQLESDVETLSVSINNTPPVVTITSPVNLDQYPMTGDTSYDMTANISDAEHSAGELSCAWTVYLHHNFHSHSSPVDTNCNTSTVISPIGCTGESYFYRFVLEVTDAHGLVTAEEVSIFPDCGGLNDPPVALNDSFVVLSGQANVLDVLSNDTDDVGINVGTVNIVTQPSSGTTSVDDLTGEVTYTHNGSASTTDGFSYTVSDDESLSSNIANVSLNVVPSDDDQPPSVPGNVRAQITGTQSVTVRWDESVDAGGAGLAGYRVLRDGVEVGFTSKRWFVDQTVALDTSYSYSVVATDYLNNASAPSVAAGVVTPSVAGLELRVNSGTTAYTDSLGNVWVEDMGFNSGSTFQVPNAILNTDDDLLYQSGRADTSASPPELGYAFPVANAVYVVNLHFADTTLFTGNIGGRLFDVALEGNTVLDDYDIYAEVGSYAATFQSFLVPVTDGELNIDFTYVFREPIIRAIEVIQYGDLIPSVAISSPTAGETVDGPDVTILYSATGDPADYDAVRFSVDGGTAVEDPTLDGTYVITGLSDGSHTVLAELVDAADQPLANPEASFQVSFDVVTPDTEAPSVPGNFMAAANGTDGATLTWDVSTDSGGSGLAGYRIYRDGVLLTGTVTNSFDDTGLSPQTTYSYAVTAYDNALNESAQTSAIDITTAAPPPSISIVSPADGGSINGPDFSLSYTLAGDPLAWDHLHVSIDGGAPIEDTALTGSLLLTGVPEGARTIQAQLVDAAHQPLANPEAMDAVAVTVLPPDIEAPSVPTGLTATSIGSDRVQLDFDDATDSGGAGLAGYNIYRDAAFVASTPVSDFLDIGLNAATGYSYTVSAYDNAGNESAQSAALNVTTTDPSTWTGIDIGTVAAAGSHVEGAFFTVNGSGRDIWLRFDEFYFVYQELIGDGEISALVSSQTNTHPWAKAGLMIRESLTDDSSNAAVILTPENGATFSRRPFTQDLTAETVNPGFAAPHWLRIVRQGDLLSGYRSADGQNWTLIDSITIAMQNQVFIGMAVSSVNDGVISTATFENVAVGLGDVEAPTVPANFVANATGPDTASLTWDPSSDSGGSGLAGYRVRRDGVIVSDQPGTGFNDSGLAPATAYSYTVAAYDGAGNESAESAAEVVQTDALPPSIVIDSPLQSASIAGPDVTLTYTLTGDPAAYDHVDVSVDGGPIIHETDLDGSVQLLALADGSHTVTAQLVDAGEAPLVNPEAQASVTFTVLPPDLTAPPVPSNLTGSAPAPDIVTLSFDDVIDTGGSGLAGYRIYRDAAFIALTPTSEYTDTGRTADTAYSYTVSAIDNAGNESAQSDAVIVTTPAVSLWTGSDIGLVAAGGSFVEGAAFTVSGSGRDIWYTADEFYFVHQAMSGDGEVRALVSSQTNTHPWAKAGVMIRGSLDADATNAGIHITPENGATFIHRDVAATHSVETVSAGLSLPRWLRIVRNGDQFSGYESADGQNWILVDSTTIPMPDPVYIGMAVSSLDDGVLGTATFENVVIEQPDVVAPNVPDGLAGSATGAHTVSLSWNASIDAGSGVAGYRLYRDDVQIADTAALDFVDAGLDADTTYGYSVSAYDFAGNESAKSAAVNVTTDALPDADADGIPDNLDNCIDVANVDQNDADGDGYGNLCDADFNNDGIVNAIDLGLMKVAFFGSDPVVDLNGDGIVNVIDLGILKTLFFQAPGPSGLAP